MYGFVALLHVVGFGLLLAATRGHYRLSNSTTFGLGTAILVYGAAVGGIFALAFAFAYGRLGRIGVRATSVLVAAMGFTAICLVPLVKYPANPPAC